MLTYYWRSEGVEKNRIEQWKKLLRKNKGGLTLCKIFDAGLL